MEKRLCALVPVLILMIARRRLRTPETVLQAASTAIGAGNLNRSEYTEPVETRR